MKSMIGPMISILWYWGMAFAQVCAVWWLAKPHDASALLLLPPLMLTHGLLVSIVVMVKTACKKGW